MSDQQPRKKLSLGKKTISTSRVASTVRPSLKNKIKAQQENTIENFYSNNGHEIAELYKQKSVLKERIIQLERKLLFAKSEPLQEFLFELKTEDFEILSKINACVSKL